MIKKMNSPLVVGIGELLWDIFPDGKKMGGAPANVIYHAIQTGCTGYVISSVGNDDSGKSLLAELEKRNISNQYIDISEDYPTGTVTVNLDDKGIPTYTIHEDVAWDYIHLNDKNTELVKKADAICFGSLAQRNSVSSHTIISLLEKSSENSLKVFDLNLRQNYYSYSVIYQSLKLCNVLKLNEGEMEEMTDLFGLKGTELDKLRHLTERFNLDLIALTKGADSSILFTLGKQSELSSPVINVADTVGAGDCFTASIISGMLKRMPLESIHKMAVDLSAWVCTNNGATPEYTLPKEWYRLF